MPGLKPDQVKVQVEEGNLLAVSGERKREKEKDQGVKYIKMERRLGKYFKTFQLPENADTEKISAFYQDGVLTVTVEKKPPPEPKKAKTVEVQGSRKALEFGARSRLVSVRLILLFESDIKEYPKSYVFIVDMPGLKSGDIKVQVEDDNVLLISGERKREEEKEGAKYVRMERRVGKFMRKFVLPENANTDAISAVCQDGVLTVTVEKLPPPEPKKPKTIEVKIA
ncbi:hypothetical protein REPUB_Repub18cG0133200 [Reevesia pubescens]